MQPAKRDEGQDAPSQEKKTKEKIDREQSPPDRARNIFHEPVPMKHRGQEEMVGAHDTRTRGGEDKGDRRGARASHARSSANSIRPTKTAVSSSVSFSSDTCSDPTSPSNKTTFSMARTTSQRVKLNARTTLGWAARRSPFKTTASACSMTICL